MTRLRPCANAHCRAEFTGRRERKFCSQACAHGARHRQPRVDRNHLLALRLLNIQPLERRPRGGWRFGTKRIGDGTVAQLIASGRAEIRGDQLHPRRSEASS